MKIVTLGGATQDIFIHHEDVQTMQLCSEHELQSFLLLQEGSKIEVDKISYSVGGGATNSAVSFKRLGFTVSSFFKIGSDHQGIMILKALEKEGVDVGSSIIAGQEQTGISYIVPSFKGERTVLAFRGANARIKEAELPLHTLKDYSYLYITSLSGESSPLLYTVAKQAKKDGVMVANNPGISQLLSDAKVLSQSLPYIDILILNRKEARQLMVSLFETDQKLYTALKKNNEEPPKNIPSLLTNIFSYQECCFSLLHFFKEVRNRGPKIVVVTNGAEGVYVCAQENIYFHPSVPTKIVNTLGAGDAFGSAFVAGIALYKSVEQAIRCGILNSISVIAHLDAKTGLLHKEQLEKSLKEMDVTLLQKFDFTN